MCVLYVWCAIDNYLCMLVAMHCLLMCCTLAEDCGTCALCASKPPPHHAPAFTDANIAVDYLDMGDTAAPSGVEGSQSAQWTEASGGVSGAGGDEEASRGKKSRIGLKVKFSAAPPGG